VPGDEAGRFDNVTKKLSAARAVVWKERNEWRRLTSCGYLASSSRLTSVGADQFGHPKRERVRPSKTEEALFGSSCWKREFSLVEH